MKILCFILCSFLCLNSLVFAADDDVEKQPLFVGITTFTPPFVLQGANNKAYGFDVDMMNSLCERMNRVCVFRVMRFDELIPAVRNNTLDAAVSAITITADRTKTVNFSLPYLLSYSRFLAKKSEQTTPFKLSQLNDKTIGIVSGTIFADQIKHMEIKNPSIVEYSKTEDLLEALSAGKIDYVLLDSPTTLYWESTSNGALMQVGPPYLFGYGLGIAASAKELSEINKALLQFQNSPDFKTNYNKYIMQF